MKQSLDRFITSFGKYSEKHPGMKWLLSAVWVLSIAWLAFFWRLGDTGLVDETEPLFAEAARQMTVTGDWITPYFNGDTRFDKPALIYWLMAIAYRIFGVNEMAARLPSATAALALTALGFYTLRRFGFSIFESRETEEKFLNLQLWLSAAIGAALIALNPITIAWARTGVSDMLLSGCMGMALLSFFLGYAQKDRDKTNNFLGFSPGYLAFYVFSALAVLTKGPVGIVLPIIIISGFLLYLGNWREVLREIHLIWGSLIFTAIALPWYILCYLRNGSAFIDSFFGYHNVERFTQVVNRHSAPWYFYFIVVLVGFFPWSIYLPLAIARLRFWQRKKWLNSPRSTHLGLFALSWFFGIFGFFTIAVTKLPSYVIPLMPAAAILVGLLFSEQLSSLTEKTRINNKGFFWSGVANAVFCTIVSLVVLSLPKIVGYDPAIPNLRQLLENSGLAILGFSIWGITAIATLILLRYRQRRPFVVFVNLLGFAAFLIFVLSPASLLLDRARQMPLRELATIVNRVQQPEEELFMVGFKKPSLVFYTQQKVNYFDNFRKASAYFEETVPVKSNRKSVLIVGQSNKIDREVLKNYFQQEIASKGAYKLLRISRKTSPPTPLLQGEGSKRI